MEIQFQHFIQDEIIKVKILYSIKLLKIKSLEVIPANLGNLLGDGIMITMTQISFYLI